MRVAVLLFLASMTSACGSGASSPGSSEIAAGEWQFAGEGVSSTNDSICITEDMAKKASFAALFNPGCKVERDVFASGRIDAVLICQGLSMEFRGTYERESLRIEESMQGRPLGLKTARRVGDC